MMLEMNRTDAVAVVSMVVDDMTELLRKRMISAEEISRTERLVKWLVHEIPKLDQTDTRAGVLLPLAEKLMKEFP